jgi:1-acyl-sn-glycerol-3-phosphate acyltransferase
VTPRPSGEKAASKVRLPRRLPKLPRVELPAALRFVTRTPSVPLGVEPAASTGRTGVDFPTEWARRAPARAVRRALHEVVMDPVVRVVTPATVDGLDRLSELDEDEPVVFAANHHSHVDTPLLLRTLPQPWRDRLFVAAAADYFFPNRVIGAASALVLNAIPIERTKVNRRSALDAAELIDDGWSMLIYPEGGRSPDGWGQPFRGGAAYLAIRCNVTVVPIHVRGTDKVMAKGRNLPRPSRVTVTFGHPLRPAHGEDSRRLAARIEAAVAALADEEATDWWQARRRFHEGTTPPLTGPRETTGWRRAWALSAEESRTTKPRWPEL